MNSKRYARFFVAGFLLIALTAVFRFWLLWRVQYSYMDGEFPWWMQQKEYVHTKGEKSEVIFLGDSRMKAGIIPNQLCENAYNLAVGGGTTVEMYYSLRDYLKFHPKPQMVVMGFGGFHYQWEDCFESRDLYFHFLPLRNQLEAQVESYKLKQGGSGLKSRIRNTLKYALIFPQKYSAACINSKFGRGEFNHGQFKKNAGNKGQMFFGTKERDDGLNSEANSQKFTVNPRVNFYLRKTIDLCKENRIPIFIEQLPMNATSYSKISESGYYAQFKSYLEKIAIETGIPVETNIPCYESECFGDSSHLNQRGAERFTAEIKEKYSL